MPCAACVADFRATLAKYHLNEHLSTPERAWELCVMLHNDVNAKLNKPIVSGAVARSDFITTNNQQTSAPAAAPLAATDLSFSYPHVQARCTSTQ